MKKLSFLPKSVRVKEQMDLQITSMADIFVIILIFLLKAYATNSVEMQLPQDVRLPMAATGAPAVESLKMEITSESIRVGGQEVTKMSAFAFDPSDLTAGIPKSLAESLAKAFQQQFQSAQAETSAQPDRRLLVLADRGTPYGVIRAALRTASLQGYTDYKLVVAEVN